MSQLAANQLQAQAIGVSLEEQARVAQQARAIFTKPGSNFYNPANAREFDRQLLGLFDSIEMGRDDIDERIERLHTEWKHEGFWQRYKDREKLDIVHNDVFVSLQRRDKELGKPAGMWQLRCNWNRLLHITNAGTMAQVTIAPAWIGPPNVAAMAIEEPTESIS